MATRTARCGCGQLQIQCQGEPVSVSLCHCTECQRRTGSTYGIAAFFPRGAVSVSGQASDWTRSSDSGHDVTFHFCPVCGSTVYWEPKRMPERIAVASGAFGDPHFPAPRQSVHGEHRHPWVMMAEGVAVPRP